MMNRNTIIGITLGSIAGIIDIIPMQIMHLPLQAILSAFSMWVVVGILISTSTIKLLPILKGIVIAYMVLLPCTFIIAWQEPISLIPIVGMTTVLGGALGWVITKV